MAERSSWATMNGASRVVDAEDSRLAVGALLTPGTSAVRARQGLRPGTGNPGRVTASGTPDVNITAEKFQAVITATRGLGEYIATLDADKTIDILTGQPAHATLQRNDLIIAEQTDTYYSDGSTAFTVTRVLGSAGAGDPSLAAHPDHIPLARVRVTALATTITSGMIDDLRPAWTVALGGLVPVANSTDRSTLTTWDGLPIYRRDRDWIEIHDGTGFRVQNLAVCASTADRDSAISSAYNGQFAVTTDTGKLWYRHSGAWYEYPGVSVVDTQNTIGTTTSSGGWTSTLTGGTACGVAFVAPPSGKVLIGHNVKISSTGSNAYCGIRVRTGAVVGSGSDVLADSINEAIVYAGTITPRMGVTKTLTGLTPFASYNVQERFIVDGGTGSFESKSLSVSPA